MAHLERAPLQGKHLKTLCVSRDSTVIFVSLRNLEPLAHIGCVRPLPELLGTHKHLRGTVVFRVRCHCNFETWHGEGQGSICGSFSGFLNSMLLAAGLSACHRTLESQAVAAGIPAPAPSLQPGDADYLAALQGQILRPSTLLGSPRLRVAGRQAGLPRVLQGLGRMPRWGQTAPSG